MSLPIDPGEPLRAIVPLLALGWTACGAPSEVSRATPAVVAPAPAAPAATPAPSQPGRIVAVGDLHGDLDNAQAVLRLAGVLGDDGHWSGGDTILVQTGDTTDRGPESPQVVALLRGLVDEAAAAGGGVVPLLGNHEVMNLLGDWRYVNPAEIAAMGGEAARRQAFSLTGDPGAWLADRDIAARVGDAVFCHGGVTAQWGAQGIDGINTAARAAIRAGDGPVLGSDGPLWYRGFVLDPEATACPALQQALDALGARRMVVGHTTRDDGRIEARCGGRLVVIDIGISDHYGAHLGALEIRGGDARALYPDGPVDLVDP